MEPLKDPISVRVSRLNSQILGKTISVQNKKSIIARESLLDVLTVLYDECNTESLKKSDKYIAQFVDEYRSTLSEIKKLRVNISDFEVKNVIGRGRFGEVHIVREKQTGDVYAMKTIRKSDSLNHQSASYIEERDIMSMNQSPWLTSLQYAFQDSAHLYLIIDFHPGGDLYGLLDRQGGTLNESQAIFYISETVQAINALHLMGYVHRDIKPDNILLDRCGHLKLADFGSAAKLNSDGAVSDKDVISVGTADYIAPEVLQSNDKTTDMKTSYGSGCDYWSLGVLAYEITIGVTPFNSDNTASTYNKIMNYNTNLKFPSDVILSEAYISLIRGLLTEQKKRLGYKQILKHKVFKDIDWVNLREKVPPFVPKLNGIDDTSNFLDVEMKKSMPSIDNFKIKTQFSGRNLPFIGFTYTHGINDDLSNSSFFKKTDTIVENKQKEVNQLQKKLAKAEHINKEYEALEKKYEDCNRKLESIENVRNTLEKNLAANVAETSALRRTLDLERRERKQLEDKALELLKTTKLKWKIAEEERIEKLNYEIEIQNNRITDYCTKNNELTSQVERLSILLQEKEAELQQMQSLQSEHKESLVKARALTRKSIAGVENRLELMNLESQNQISDLQKSLFEALENNKVLESENESLKKREQEFKEENNLSTELCNNLKKQLIAASSECKELKKEVAQHQEYIPSLKTELNQCKDEVEKLRSDNKCSRLEEALKLEKDECHALKKQLKELSDSFNQSVASFEASIQEQNSKKESDIKILKEKLKLAEEEIEILNNKLKEAHEQELSNKVKVQNLEQLLARLENGVTKLESNSDREPIIQEQIKHMEEQIKELHETSAVEKQELRTIRLNLWRKEKELSNVELDKKIVERMLTETNGKVKSLEEELKQINVKLDEKQQNYENLLTEMKDNNKELEEEIKTLEKTITDLKQELETYKIKCEKEQIINETKTEEMVVALQTIENFKNQLEAESKLKTSLEQEVQTLKDNNIELNKKLEICEQLKSECSNELEIIQIKLKSFEFNGNILRDACTVLENQLDEYDNLMKISENTEKELNNTIIRLNLDTNNLKKELQEAKSTINEEKSLKLLAESKCKRLEEDLNLCKVECDSYKTQLAEYKSLSTQLSNNIAEYETLNSELEAKLNAQERHIEKLQNENSMLKEETSGRLTHIHQIRESNYKLNQELLEYKDLNLELSAKVLELEESLNEQNNYYKQRELKTEATIQQHIKLIDFLQSKIEDGKKKKTFTDKLFGNSKKENTPPHSLLNYKELETMLLKEKEANKSLKDEIQKLKSNSVHSSKLISDSSETISAPPNSPRTKLALEQLVRSPASQGDDFKRNPSVQRMHHNIPHRFESRLCKKSLKCQGCSENLQIGRTVSTCTECSISVHNRCTASIPRTCGLPNEFAKHFKRTLSELSTKSTTSSDTKSEVSNNVLVESWLKVLMQPKNNWEKKYCRIEDTKLAIYEHKPTSNMSPISTIDLCPSDGVGCLNSDLQTEDIGHIAATDFPFVIRIDLRPRTTCWPATSHFLMTLNISDKDNWITALNELFQRKYPEFSRYSVVLKLCQKVEIVCVEEINKDIILFGCEEGLFSSTQGNPLLNIFGVTNIQQIRIIKSINTVLMIADPKRLLLRAELRQLESLTQSAPCSNPTLTMTPINIHNRNGYHLFEVSNFKKNNIICAATDKQLFIIKYELETNDFIPLRMLDTAEPSSCILFNDHSVIVGANKFYEIDLKTFSADEFLDVSDQKLKHAVNCDMLGSYPVAIMVVNKNPLEYLICFNEFGVFVDEYGRKNRESDLKWSHLPLGFSYCAPFLYIIQFSAVEIVRIAAETYDNVSLQSWVCPDSIRLEFSKPKYLGSNKNGIYLLVKNDVIFVNGKNICGDDFLSDLESNIDNDGSDGGTEFSFTSSMVNSLDQISTEEETERINGITESDL